MLATNSTRIDQRYYASTTGRFLTPDPYKASGGPADPQSWNQYAYVKGDPVNRVDPLGLMDTGVECREFEDNGSFGAMDYTSAYLEALSAYQLAHEGGDPWWAALPSYMGFGTDYTGTQSGAGTTSGKPPVNSELMPWAKAIGKSALSLAPCAEFFGLKSDTAAAIFEAMTSGGKYGKYGFTLGYADHNLRWGAAEAKKRGRSLTVTINSNTTHDPTKAYLWNDANDTMNAYLLLHEFGHVARFMGYKDGGFQHNDDGAMVDPNKKDISEKCLNGKI